MGNKKTHKNTNILQHLYTCLGLKVKCKLKNDGLYLTPSMVAWYGLEASCRVGYTEDKGNIQRWRGCCGRV